MNIIILANGLFPTSERVLQLFEGADRVVCCDGAFENYLRWYGQQTVRPTHSVAVVGDGDSLKPSAIECAKVMGIDYRRQVVAEQENNDLSKAVRYAVEQASGRVANNDDVAITILGATGLREDHMLGNISLLGYYLVEFPDIRFSMVSDYGTFLPMRGRRIFSSYAGQQVSIFSLTPMEPVSVSGLRYPICGRCLSWLWEGTLNESLGDKFEVQGGTLVVYLKH